MDKQFKKGKRVKCVDNKGACLLRLNEEYVIIRQRGIFVDLEGGLEGYYSNRFEPAPQAKPAIRQNGIFKKGDKVKCILPAGMLVLNQTYSVSQDSDGLYIYINVGGSKEGWLNHRFKLVTAVEDVEGTKTVVKKPAKKADVVKDITPQVIKRGSLYKITRNKQKAIIARYRNPAFDDLLVFSVHNKLMVVKRDRVRVATKAEVNSYLGIA